MTRVVFHLGDHKTGSTAIQSTLASGGWSCADVRLFYPQAERISHLLLAKSLNEAGAKRYRAGRFREVLAEIAASGADVAVISAEQFEGTDPVALRQAIVDYMPGCLETARFVAYVRPHAERILSSFSEVSKLGHFDGSLATHHKRTLAKGRFRYAKRFQRWRDTFGGAFALRPMIRDQLFQRDVVADFLHMALDGAAFEIETTPQRNEALSLEDLLIVRQFHTRMGEFRNTANLSMMMGISLGHRMADHPAAQATKMQLPRDLAERIAAVYAKDAAALDAAFFTGTPMSDALRAAPLNAVEPAQSLRIEDHFSGSERRLVDILSTLIADILRVMPDDWPSEYREANRRSVTKIEAPVEMQRAGRKQAVR